MYNPNVRGETYLIDFGVAIRVGGSGLCHVKIRVYGYMAQPVPVPFINHVKVYQSTLTQNSRSTLTCLFCVGYVSGLWVMW